MQRRATATAARPPSGALGWDDVRLFLALARARTVGAAGATLGVDASTVSRRLVALEEVMGARLFDRGRDGVTATEAAEHLLPVAEEIEAAVARFTRTAGSLEREVTGPVRITCPVDVAEVVVVPLLEPLLARHPGLRVTLDPSEEVRDLARHEADLALRVVRPVRGDLVVTRVATVRWILAASPARARALGSVRSLRELRWITCDRLDLAGPGRWLAEHAAGVDPILRSDSLAVQFAAARAGLGCALLPEPSLDQGGLVPVKLAAPLRRACEPWPTDDLFLVTHRALRDVPRVRAVWDALVEGLAPMR